MHTYTHTYTHEHTDEATTGGLPAAATRRRDGGPAAWKQEEEEEDEIRLGRITTLNTDYWDCTLQQCSPAPSVDPKENLL